MSVYDGSYIWKQISSKHCFQNPHYWPSFIKSITITGKDNHVLWKLLRFSRTLILSYPDCQICKYNTCAIPESFFIIFKELEIFKRKIIILPEASCNLRYGWKYQQITVDGRKANCINGVFFNRFLKERRLSR